jgi:hypothetical protein
MGAPIEDVLAEQEFFVYGEAAPGGSRGAPNGV